MAAIPSRSLIKTRTALLSLPTLVGFSYGTHLGLACIRYHGAHLHRVVLIGTEGPDHTEKLPGTSDASLRRLAEVVAKAPELEGKLPDLVGLLKRLLERFEKDPVVVRITDARSGKLIDVKVGKFGLQHLIFRDLGDTNDLPIFPAWFYTMDKGDYSILSRFVERRYNQYGSGLSVMTLRCDQYESKAAPNRGSRSEAALQLIRAEWRERPCFQPPLPPAFIFHPPHLIPGMQ